MRERTGVVVAISGALTAVAAATAWLTRSEGGAWSWHVALGLAALLAVGEYLILRFRFRNDTMGLNLFEAALAPAILALPGAAVVAIAAAAQLGTGVVRRNEPRKIWFNTAQWSAAAGVAALVFARIARPGSAARDIAGILAALTAIAALNVLAFGTVVAAAESSAFRAVVRRIAPSLVAGWIVNTGFGLLFVAAYRWSPLSLALFPIPLLTLHLAYRAWASLAAEHARLRGMNEALQVLAGAVEPRDALPDFLEIVRTRFQAARALLCAQEGARHVVVADAGNPHVGDAERALLLAMLDRPGAPFGEGLHAPLRRAGYDMCLAVRLPGGSRGVLCTLGREGAEGFEEGERAVLAALAHQAASALAKSRLLAEALEERRRYAGIVQGTSDGILTIAADGSIAAWNPAMERITGFTADEMAGARSICALGARDVCDNIVDFERWQSAVLPPEITVLTRNGTRKTLSCSSTSTVDPANGEPLLIVVARDITELRAAERMREDFVAAVSHEMRTPLTPIRGWASTLLAVGDRLDSEERTEAIRTILRQTGRLERLLTNLLESSKIEHLDDAPENNLIDVAQIATRVAGDFRQMWDDRPIRLELDPEAGEAVGSDLWVEQIIANLLSNAMKYAPAGEPVTVSVAGERDGVIVRVADLGPGVPDGEADKVFDRFHRMSDRGTRAKGGAGLGLYIARRMAEEMGGSLTLAPSDAGATFILRVPRPKDVISLPGAKAARDELVS